MTDNKNYIKAVLRFKRTVADIANDREPMCGLDEEITSDAAAFLQYLKDIEERYIAAEARAAELTFALEARLWRPSLESQPDDGEWVLIYSEEFGYDMVTALYVIENASSTLHWQPLLPPPTEEE